MPVGRNRSSRRPLFFASIALLACAATSGCGGCSSSDSGVKVAEVDGVPTVEAENWPVWRGPRGDGTSHEAQTPRTWASDKNIAWRTLLAGGGYSSPVVWQDHIFVTSAVEQSKQRLLSCYSRLNGSLLWQREVMNAPFEHRHPLNGVASSTPATDGKHVYVSFLDGDRMLIAAYDFLGRLKWLVHPGPYDSRNGYCSTPVLFENMVIVNGDSDGPAFLAALDGESGAEIWRTPREHPFRSYVPPLIGEIAGRTQLVYAGSKCVASYDPRTGKQLWVVDGPTDQFVASLVYHRDLLFLTSGDPQLQVMAIRPDGEGNVTKTHVAWQTQEGAAVVPSPVGVAGYFLLVSDGGVGSCFECASGKRVWAERLGTHFSSSPIVAGGLVYFTDEEGVTKIVRPGPTFELVEENLLGEKVFASPAVSRGNIFLRGEQNLVCIGPQPK